MSGSNSSARGAQPAPDALSPVGLTVHSLPAPRLEDDARRRTVVGRVKMLLVLLVCASPVIASYFTYFVIRPDGRTNYGELIQPTRTLPEGVFRDAEGRPVGLSALKGQWLIVSVAAPACDTGCEQRLFLQRQLREMLGKERDRLDKVWIVTGEGAPRAEALRAASEGAPVTVLRADREAVLAWLRPAQGQALEDHLYLVDPMGEWMMRMPADPQPQKVKRDLERLLRASSFWDSPGRG